MLAMPLRLESMPRSASDVFLLYTLNYLPFGTVILINSLSLGEGMLRLQQTKLQFSCHNFNSFGIG